MATSGPIENIRICVVGCVSAGKTTLLEALFLAEEQLSQTGMRRTTMIPSLFAESDKQDKDISSVINKLNESYADKTSLKIVNDVQTPANKLFTLSDLEKDIKLFNVGSLDMGLAQNTAAKATKSKAAEESKNINSSRPNITLIDIPGINDARAKGVYYEYLNKYFIEFNIVIFVVDTNSALNTADEMDLLKCIADNTRKAKLAGRKIYTICIANKADDMQVVTDPKTKTETIKPTDELEEMYDQIVKFTREQFSKDIPDHLIGVVPICSHDAYLYRMIEKYGAKYKLTKPQISKIGVNDHGKKFNSLSDDKKDAIIKKLITDNAQVQLMIRMSGFQRFKEVFSRIIEIRGDELLNSNIALELSKFPKIEQHLNGELAVTDLGRFNNIFNVAKKVCVKYAITVIAEYRGSFELRTKELISKFNDIKTLKQKFADMRATLKGMIGSHFNIDEFPDYYTSKCIELTIKDIKSNFTLDNTLNRIFELKEIKQFNTETVNMILNLTVEHINSNFNPSPGISNGTRISGSQFNFIKQFIAGNIISIKLTQLNNEITFDITDFITLLAMMNIYILDGRDFIKLKVYFKQGNFYQIESYMDYIGFNGIPFNQSLFSEVLDISDILTKNECIKAFDTIVINSDNESVINDDE